MAKTKKLNPTQQTVRNIETGQVKKVGPNFLDRQAKPFQGRNRLYDNGVWVASDAKPTKDELSDKAKSIVADAGKAPVSNAPKANP